MAATKDNLMEMKKACLTDVKRDTLMAVRLEYSWEDWSAEMKAALTVGVSVESWERR